MRAAPSNPPIGKRDNMKTILCYFAPKLRHCTMRDHLTAATMRACRIIRLASLLFTGRPAGRLGLMRGQGARRSGVAGRRTRTLARAQTAPPSRRALAPRCPRYEPRRPAGRPVNSNCGSQDTQTSGTAFGPRERSAFRVPGQSSTPSFLVGMPSRPRSEHVDTGISAHKSPSYLL